MFLGGAAVIWGAIESFFRLSPRLVRAECTRGNAAEALAVIDETADVSDEPAAVVRGIY